MADNSRGTDRLEYFSDAVFAIAATLLASELPLPRAGNLERFDDTILQVLGRHWASYAGFAASFLFIGVAWANHHAIFRYIRRTDHNLLILNLVFLMGIVLYGWATKLVVEHLGKPQERTSVLIYYALLFLTSLLYNAVWWYAARRKLLEDLSDDRVRALSREYAFVPGLHAVAFIVALWSVTWSLLPLLALYGFFAMPRRAEDDSEDGSEQDEPDEN